MLRKELIYVVLELQNKNTDPITLDVACGQIKKRKGLSSINEKIKRKLYKWITGYTQVVQSTISNYCLKVIFDYQMEPQMVPILLL